MEDADIYESRHVPDVDVAYSPSPPRRMRITRVGRGVESLQNATSGTCMYDAPSEPFANDDTIRDIETVDRRR